MAQVITELLFSFIYPSTCGIIQCYIYACTCKKKYIHARIVGFTLITTLNGVFNRYLLVFKLIDSDCIGVQLEDKVKSSFAEKTENNASIVHKEINEHMAFIN